ncbi:MAG: hypothetical protein V3V47_01820 [Desulfobacteria bacterium]
MRHFLFTSPFQPVIGHVFPFVTSGPDIKACTQDALDKYNHYRVCAGLAPKTRLPSKTKAVPFDLRRIESARVALPKKQPVGWNWTAKTPTKVGWYWYRFNADDLGTMLRIREDNDGRTSTLVACVGSDARYLSSLDGHWCGPIRRPRPILKSERQA